MRITVINGIPDDNFRAHEDAIKHAIEKMRSHHTIDYFITRNMDLKHCLGCFNCWVKTPGYCTIKDDMEQIIQSLVKTDFLLLVSPLSAGFISWQTKNVLDRSIPIILPYIKVYYGECHHSKRYNNKIDLGIIILDDGVLDPRAVDITNEAFQRNALNFHSEKLLKYTATPDEVKDIFNEINSY